MKKGLMNNWGLKILSFLLAVMLWLIVVNIDDPVTTQTFNNIPVAVTNAEVLAATNQTYQIEDGTQNVSVTVRAKRSVLNKIKADNIKATADMKELTLQTQIPHKKTHSFPHWIRLHRCCSPATYSLHHDQPKDLQIRHLDSFAL